MSENKILVISSTGPEWLILNQVLLDIHASLRLPLSSVGKESVCNAGDPGSIPGSGRPPGEGNGNPLQYSCLENPMNRGAWWATVRGVARVGHDLATKPPPPPHTSLHKIFNFPNTWGCVGTDNCDLRGKDYHPGAVLPPEHGRGTPSLGGWGLRPRLSEEVALPRVGWCLEACDEASSGSVKSRCYHQFLFVVESFSKWDLTQRWASKWEPTEPQTGWNLGPLAAASLHLLANVSSSNRYK